MGLSAEEVIRRSRRELEKARNRHQVVAALAPLRGRNATQVAAALFEFMVEFPDWSPLIADKVERLIALRPGLASKQRVFLGYTRAEALAVLARQSHRWAVAALLTLHHDGFVREAAVVEASRDRRAIPFIVNRYSDWVPEVAAAARRVTVPQEAKADASTWRQAIERAHRIRGTGAEMLSRLLGNPEARKSAMTDPVAAQVVLKEVLALQPDDPLAVAGLASPHGTVRLAIAERLQPDEDSLPLIERLLRDPMPSIRIEALRMLAKVRPDHPGVRNARLDTNFRVRSQARIQTGDRAASLAFYRASLPLPAAIEGIGETGNRFDAPTVLPYLEDADPRKRRAAIRALTILDTRETVPQIKSRMADPSGRVVREAVRALRSMNATVEIEEVESSLSPSHPSRRALLAVADLMPKWEAGLFLVRHATHPEWEEAVESRLWGWVAHMRVRSVSPKRMELIEFSNALSDDWLSDSLRATLRDLVKRWS